MKERVVAVGNTPRALAMVPAPEVVEELGIVIDNSFLTVAGIVLDPLRKTRRSLGGRQHNAFLVLPFLLQCSFYFLGSNDSRPIYD